MLPDRDPAEGRHTIDIELLGSDHQDYEQAYWTLQIENLERQFERKVRARIESRDLRNLSVFAFAPQPLLIKLGHLLGDITPAFVYQRHREPVGWKWPPDGRPVALRVHQAGMRPGPVALVVSLSATITNNRIEAILGDQANIWRIEAEEPNNDLLKRPADLVEFRRFVRATLNAIKATHGEDATIHLFPALPVSAAVEVGRVWMPKSDLPLVVYDQQRQSKGFTPVLNIP